MSHWSILPSQVCIWTLWGLHENFLSGWLDGSICEMGSKRHDRKGVNFDDLISFCHSPFASFICPLGFQRNLCLRCTGRNTVRGSQFGEARKSQWMVRQLSRSRKFWYWTISQPAPKCSLAWHIHRKRGFVHLNFPEFNKLALVNARDPPDSGTIMVKHLRNMFIANADAGQGSFHNPNAGLMARPTNVISADNLSGWSYAYCWDLLG